MRDFECISADWPEMRLAQSLLQSLDLDIDAAARRRTIEAFERTFILIVGVEYWCRALPRWNSLSPFYTATLLAGTVLCGAALTQRLRRIALLLLAFCHIAIVSAEFPAAGNHAYLEIFICLLVALVDPEVEAEQRLLLRALRWSMIVVFFYSGLHKLVHGYYFHGQYFAYSLSQESFRKLFQFLLPASELQRLAHYTGHVGDGPYLIASPLVLLISNAIWILELACAPLLLWNRARPLAVAIIATLLVSIEIGAREIFFGLVFVNGLWLFTTPRRQERLLVTTTVLLACLLSIRFGILPEVTFY